MQLCSYYFGASQDFKLQCYHILADEHTEIEMKNSVFWDVALYRYCVNRRFGGTYHLHLQVIRNPRARNQREQMAADSV
jgi:hypothetical protein